MPQPSQSPLNRRTTLSSSVHNNQSSSSNNNQSNSSNHVHVHGKNCNHGGGYARQSPLHPTVQKCLGKQGLTILLMLVAFWFGFLIRSHAHIPDDATFNLSHPHPLASSITPGITSSSSSSSATSTQATALPLGFEHVLSRAQHKDGHCRHLQQGTSKGYDLSSSIQMGNDTIASLPSFGIIGTIEQWKEKQQQQQQQYPKNKPIDEKWQCVLPPDHECAETQFTVVFMAYNPDRLGMALKQIQKMFEKAEWHGLVKEVVVVWNGPRKVDESPEGVKLLAYANQDHPVRVVYPLKLGFPNDLMNRYHPDVVQVTTKAILFYDDDGPFYSPSAVLGGFELWKRHSSAQVGAMARQIDYSPRQTAEQVSVTSGQPSDRFFVSHCTNLLPTPDRVDYNFRYFANFDANMVLPSGSFLHANYLCFLWHPVLEPVREFVRAHPVHPDDVTVSMLVSQLGGRAPRVYSRRCEKPDKEEKQQQQQDNGAGAGKSKKKDNTPPKAKEEDTTTTTETKSRRSLRRLAEEQPEWEYEEQDEDEEYDFEEDELTGIIPLSERGRRQLLFGIDWDAGSGMNDAKKYWAALRAEAVNALVQYFGSINSGSIGWCHGTKYYDEKVPGKCKPIMAKQGQLPWMNPDHTAKATCP
jgi:hypothetical protein